MLSISNIAKVAIGISFLFSAGCASKASQQGQSPASESKTPDELKKDEKNTAKKPNTGGGTSSIEGYTCDSGSSLNFAEGKYDIDGNNLSLFKGRSKSKMTLCEVLKQTGKKAAIFQFAGWYCTSCMNEAKALQKFVSSSNGKDVAHILVFTDLFEDSRDEDFKDFIDSYAPKATVMYDESKLWKYYSKDPANPSRATIMTMNLNAEGQILNEEGQFDKIFDAATALVGKL